MVLLKVTLSHGRSRTQYTTTGRLLSVVSHSTDPLWAYRGVIQSYFQPLCTQEILTRHVWLIDSCGTSGPIVYLILVKAAGRPAKFYSTHKIISGEDPFDRCDGHSWRLAVWGFWGSPNNMVVGRVDTRTGVWSTKWAKRPVAGVQISPLVACDVLHKAHDWARGIAHCSGNGPTIAF